MATVPHAAVVPYLWACHRAQPTLGDGRDDPVSFLYPTSCMDATRGRRRVLCPTVRERNFPQCGTPIDQVFLPNSNANHQTMHRAIGWTSMRRKRMRACT